MQYVRRRCVRLRDASPGTASGWLRYGNLLCIPSVRYASPARYRQNVLCPDKSICSLTRETKFDLKAFAFYGHARTVPAGRMPPGTHVVVCSFPTAGQRLIPFCPHVEASFSAGPLSWGAVGVMMVAGSLLPRNPLDRATGSQTGARTVPPSLLPSPALVDVANLSVLSGLAVWHQLHPAFHGGYQEIQAGFLLLSLPSEALGHSLPSAVAILPTLRVLTCPKSLGAWCRSGRVPCVW